MKKEISRRKFLQISALAAGATMLPMPVRWLGTGSAQAFANSQPLSKWGATQPLRGLNIPATHPLATLIPNDPNGIPVMAGTPDPAFANTRFYEVAINEFTDTLHPSMPAATKLWGYSEVGAPAQRHLGGLIIATRGEASRIRFANNLNVASHIIPVDTSLPGANIFNKVAVHLHGGEIPWISDGGPFDWWTPTGQTGLAFANGAGSMFDNVAGKPMGINQADYYYPNNQSTRLMWYHDHAHGITRLNAYAGVATGYLCVDIMQEKVVSAGTLAANPAGDNVPFIGSAVPIVFQDKIFVSPTTAAIDPTWAAAAPRSTGTGSLWYAHVYDPKLYKLQKGGAFLPPPALSCVPEFFGDTMLANGTVYPVATVEAKPTRFLFLNACNARFLNMNLYQVPVGSEIWTDPKTGLPGGTIPSTGAAAVPVVGVVPLGPPLWQIGTEAGYLAAPTSFPNGLLFNPITFTGNLILGCAERADVVIDFSNHAGQEFIIYNDAPGPFPVGAPMNDYYWGNPKNPLSGPPGSGPDTRQILRIKVVAATGTPANPPSATMLAGVGPERPLVNYAAIPPAPAAVPVLPAPAGAVVKNFTLNEDFDPNGRLRQLVGTLTPVLPGGNNNKIAAPFGREYLAALQPEDQHVAGAVEVWNIYNTTADTHPMHIHLSSAQILQRQPFALTNGIPAPIGVARGPERNELGWKETFKINPGEITTICMRWEMPAVPFTVPSSPRATVAVGAATMGLGLPASPTPYNEYVWHCHILEHEEHDMMRPLIVTGQNPQRPNITPTSASFAFGVVGTAAFTVTLAPTATSFTVTDPAGGPASTLPAGNSFTVPVSATTAVGSYTYTVTDSAGLTSTVTITVV